MCTNSNPITDDSDTETQSPSPPSSSFSGAEEMDDDGETIPLAGETQVLDFDEETQVLEYLEEEYNDDQNVRTQLLDDDGDGEGSDKTEVLSSDGDDDDDDGDALYSKGYAVDSDVGTDTDDKPSALVGDFVQSSSLMITPMTNNYGKSYFPNKSLCGERHPDMDDGIDGLKDPISVCLEVKNADLHNNMQCDMRMEGRTDKTELGYEKLTGDKLMNEDISIEIDECVKNSYEGPKEVSESPAYDHQFAGLSYVGSQEPGEFSQANALNVVDRYLAANHVDFSQEDGCAITLDGLSPLISRPKGTQILAKSSGIKNPIRDVAVYDWVDSNEDGGCRDNSTNNRSGCRDQRSLPQPQKPRCLSRKEGMSANKSGEDSLNLHQKLRCSTCSDTGVLCISEQNANIVQSSEVSTVKKLSSALDEKLNTDSLEKPLEGNSHVDLPDAYDIGFDTQMAAEAMEALCHVDSPTRDAGNVCQVSEKVHCGFPKVVTNSGAPAKNVYVRKRVSSASGASTNQSKKRKLAKKVDYVKSDLSDKDLKILQTKESIKVSLVSTKSKIVKSKVEGRGTYGISFGGGQGKCPRPSKLAQSRKTKEALEKLTSKHLKRCDGKKTSYNNFEVDESRVEEDFRCFTPIACRTRRSIAAKPLIGSVLLNCYDVPNARVATSLSMDKTRGYCSNVDAPALGKKHKLDSSQIRRAGKHELIQLESPAIGIMLEETAKNKKTDFQSNSRVKRKCQNVSKASNLDGAFNVASGQDIHEQYIPQRKRSKICGRDSSRAKSSTVWGSKLNVHLLSDVNRNDMSRVTAEDKIKSSNRSTISNRMNATEAPSPVCLGLNSTSRKAAPVPPINEVRQIRVLADVRLLLSHHLDDHIIKQQQKISSRLGFSLVSSSSEATHFIADKFVRTRNMLEAIAFGKPVVTHLWLESCKKTKSLVDETNYILRDFEKEKEFGFKMPVSLARARACSSQLLQGKKIFVTPNVKPSRELVMSLAMTVHGQVVKRIGRSEMRGDNFSEDLLVLSCEEDYATCVPLLLKRAAVYSSELILNGIIIQKLEYERHRLFGDRGTR